MSLMTKLGLKTLVASCLIAVGTAAHAQLNVLVTGVGSTQFPIATATFANEANSPQQISAIVRQIWRAAASFTNIDAALRPSLKRFRRSWQLESERRDAFVSGSVNRLPNGQYEVRFRLYDTVKQQSLGGLSLVSPESGLRMSAHKVADYIYAKLLGDRGVFATRLSYVIKTAAAISCRFRTPMVRTRALRCPAPSRSSRRRGRLTAPRSRTSRSKRKNLLFISTTCRQASV